MDAFAPMLPALAALAGLLFGSFLNVCIARLPRHQSIAWPGSHCPLCAAPIRAWDNVPLLSFVALRGRCRACGGRISRRYPLVEAGLAGLFAAAAFRFPSGLLFAEAGLLCFLLLGLLVTDAETMLLPNSLTLPGLLLGLAQAALPGGGLIAALRLGVEAPVRLVGWPAPASSAVAAGAAAGLLLLLRFLYFLVRRREGMGLGDVKLAAMLGAWLGIAGVSLTLVVAVFAAAFAGLVLLRRARGSARPLQLPFGSFLCAAGLVVLFFGRALLHWYFSLWPQI